MTLTRRGAIGAGLSATTVGACATSNTERTKRGDGQTFVLVHGAWHGGWCWERVAAALRAEGARVFAPTLTGLGERSHLLSPSINLTTHVMDVVGELRWKSLTDVTLVGHSYGGMVITGVAARETNRLKSIVYLDAFLPESGQSLRDITKTRAPATDGPLPPLPTAAFVSGKDVQWVEPLLTPQPGATFSEPVPSVGAINQLAKRTYIQALVGATPFFAAAYERAKADPLWITHQIDGHHDLMIDAPDLLSDLLLQAAT